jgi:signal transduction histidine kinase
VFDNILSNALKYTPPGGAVTIDSRSTGSADGRDGPQTVSVSVTDTGPGIPPAFRARIFDKFFRLGEHHHSERPPTRGAGIGLYMCRQIIQLHGGDISCTSGLDDRGTCISVRVPTANPTGRSIVSNAVTSAGP